MAAAAQSIDLQLKVPSFTGEETRVEVQSFMLKLKACIAKIPDAPQGANAAELRAVSRKKAQMMTMNFTGKAFTWLEKWQRDNPNNAEDYDTLLTAFKARYFEPEHMTDINEVIATLKQANNESVEDFWDRCHKAACAVMNYDDTPAAARQAPDFITARNRILCNFFVMGVKLPIRQQIAQLANKPIDDIIREAKVIEKSHKLEQKKTANKKGGTQNGHNNGHKSGSNGSNGSKKVHEINHEQEEEEEEETSEEKEKKNGEEQDQMIEAFRQFLGTQRGRGRFRGRGGPNRGRGFSRGRGNYNNYPNGWQRNGNSQGYRQNGFTCDLCQQFGHGIRQCPLLPKAKAQVKPQNNSAASVSFGQSQGASTDAIETAQFSRLEWPDFM